MGSLLWKIARKLGEQANKIDAHNIVEQLGANDLVNLITDILL